LFTLHLMSGGDSEEDEEDEEGDIRRR